jgi:bacillithiol system protein YtxJ
MPLVLYQMMPVAIFKHSTRCSISRMALKQFENEFDFPVTPYFLDQLLFAKFQMTSAVLACNINRRN